MTEKIKNYLGLALIVAVLVGAASAWNYVSAYSRSIQPSSFRSFSVSGEGRMVSVPDVAQFTFSVLTEGGKDIAGLQRENTEKINKAIDFVKKAGVEAKDIETQNYNLDPRYKTYNCYGPKGSESCPPPEIVGYTINQMVAVKVRDFSKIGDILSGVVGNGANTVSQLSFTIDDPYALQNKARAEAIEKAKAKAQLIADAGGFAVGRLLSIDDGYYPMPYAMDNYARNEVMGMGGGGPVAAPSIEPGSQEVRISVNLRYEIQ